MTFYWIFLILIAILAYVMGSISTLNIASIFIYKKNLRRLGEGNIWLSNFKRIFGTKGIITLFLIEILKDLLPILIAGLIFGIKEQAELGRAFAGFCLVLGRLFPVFNRFRGSYGSGALIVAAFGVKPSIGAFVLLIFIGMMWAKRYITLATVVSAFMFIAISMVLVENSLIMTLCIFTGALVIIRLVPKVMGLVQGREEKLSFKEDISYKFDQKF